VEAAEAPDDVDGAEHGVRTYGSIIAWNSADQLSALGILHVILALILVSGKVITDSTSSILLFLPFPIPRSDAISQWTYACFSVVCVSALQHNSHSPLILLTAL
jgi:hypothetical protein